MPTNEDSRLLARVDANVQNLMSTVEELRADLKEHRTDDKNDFERVYGYIKPLLQERSERKGAERMGKVMWSFLIAAIGAISGYLGGHR